MSAEGAYPAVITLEPASATEADARQVMAWRNDPAARAASFHREQKLWETFWPEYRDGYFPADAPEPVFAVNRGRRVGFVRFRRVEHPEGAGRRCVDISINLAPEHRGRGFAQAMLHAAHGQLRALGVGAVYAEVRAENDKSHRAFEAAGYRSLGEAEKLVEDTGERCRIVRYLRELAA